MLFSSVIFLFAFLPFTLGVYFLTPARFRNYTLLLLGFFFYFSTEGSSLVILIASLAINYIAGLLMEREKPQGQRDARRIIFVVALACNVFLLVFYKYLGFFAQQGAFIGKLWGWSFSIPSIYLPLGISFFTFKGLSYLIDVYRGDTEVERNATRYALYQSFFPQLLAGPIARYHNMAYALRGRTVTLIGFWSGAERFIIGLGKKALIANQLGPVADQVFTMPMNQ